MTLSRFSLFSFMLMSTTITFGYACTQKTEAEEAEPGVVLRDREYQADRDTIWSALLGTYASLEIPIETVSAAAGRIQGAFLHIPETKRNRDYMSCGSSGVLGDWIDQPTFKAEYSLSLLVLDLEEGGIEVKVRASYSGQLGANRMGCGSTGKLEDEFFVVLDSLLKAEAVDSKSG